MSYHLLKTADKIPLSPLVALVGPESFVRKQLRDSLIKRALAGAIRDMNYSAYQAGEDELGPAFDACRNFPCFADKRVVSISSLAKIKKKEAEELMAYLVKPQPSTLLILEDEKLDGRLDWVKRIKKHAEWIEVPPADLQESLDWVRQCLAKEGKKADGELAEMLVGWIGNSLEALQNAVTQLSLFVGDRPSITRADLETLLVKVSEENVFQVIDAVFLRKPAELHRSLGALLESGEAPLKILALLFRHLSILLSLQESDSRKTAGLFRLSPYILRSYEQQARRFAKQITPSILAPVVQADVKLKGSSLPNDLILKNCVEEIGRMLGLQ